MFGSRSAAPAALVFTVLMSMSTISAVPMDTVGTTTLSATGMSWPDASDYCNASGLHLLSIHSSESHELAAALCDTAAQDFGCWIGLHRYISSAEDSEGSAEWIWDDGSSTDYGFIGTSGVADNGSYPWYTGEPNGASTGEDCVHLSGWANHTWIDMTCSSFFYAICEGTQ